MSFLDSVKKMFSVGEDIRPELIVAFNSKIPNEIKVNIHSSQDGGYIAEIKELEYCVTQANSGKEIIKMVNDAMHTSLGIPEEYKKYVTYYLPPQEILEKFNMEIPREYINKEFRMKKVVA